MPNTRARAAVGIIENGSAKNTAPLETRRRSARKTAERQHLQNITNNTVTVPAVRKSRRLRHSGVEMGSEDVCDDSMSAASDLIQPRTVSKRKCSEERQKEVDKVEMEDLNLAKKLKEKAEESSMAKDTSSVLQEAKQPNTACGGAQNASPVRECCAAIETATSLAEDNERPSTSNAALAIKPSTSDDPQTAKDEAFENSINESSPRNMTLSDKLLLVISHLYLNAAERLKLDFPPRCAADLEHCHQHHYRAPLPPAPNQTQANNLRCALQQQRYVSFINWSYDMCQRGEYPGEGIFTKIIELVLSFNSNCYNTDAVRHFFNKSIELFAFIVRKFPPCWLSLRPFYINFLQTPLDTMKISKNAKKHFRSNNVLEILLELLEETLEQCSATELQCDNDVDGDVASDITKANSFSEAAIAASASAALTSQMPPNTENSQNSEYLNIWEWEVQQSRLQTFEALRSPSTRLQRIFISLQLLLQILEHDLVMWILHHYKKTKDWIFCETNRPLVVLAFGLSKYSRLTGVVKQLFTLFASNIQKEAKRTHLLILERFISLAVVASNMADLEHTASGVRFPKLGAETKTLIHEFFKIFKSYNGAHIRSYLQAVSLLRIPCMRYEFIDHFLRTFHLSSRTNETMSPKKISNEIFKKRWLRYRTRAELRARAGGDNADEADDDGDDDEMSREQYLQLLLMALQSYCEFHGIANFFTLLTKDKLLHSFSAVTDSGHRWPAKNAKGSVVLSRIRTDIEQLERQELELTEQMLRPKVALPLIEVCIDDELMLQYRTDLKYVMLLHGLVARQTEEAKAQDVDFRAWRAFLVDFENDTK